MKRLIIGITGGIATGKTVVLRELRRRGIPTIASDDLAHDCLRRGHLCYTRIVRRFGPKIVKAGRIDRRRLGAIVFANPAERKWLERLIHPQVIRRLKSFIRRQRGIAALDIPLLFEARLEHLVDRVIVVWAPQSAQLRRIKRRNGLDRSAALKRIRAQWPLERKKKRADDLIANTGPIGSLRKRVGELLVHLKEEA